MQADEPKIWAELHDKHFLPHRKARLTWLNIYIKKKW